MNDSVEHFNLECDPVSINLPDLLKIITFVFCMFTLRFHLSQSNLRLSNNFCKPFAACDISTMSSAYNKKESL
jgi:hypothetical protein